MKTALRVLTALTERYEPDAEDLASLRRRAPEQASAAIDELACHVIQSALRERAELRRLSGS